MNTTFALAGVSILFQVWLFLAARERGWFPIVALLAVVVAATRLGRWKLGAEKFWLGMTLTGIASLVQQVVHTITANQDVDVWRIFALPLAHVMLIGQAMLLFKADAVAKIVRYMPAMMIVVVSIVFSLSTLPGLPGLTLGIAIVGLSLVSVLSSSGTATVEYSVRMRRWSILVGTLAVAALGSSYVLAVSYYVPHPEAWLANRIATSIGSRRVARQYVRTANLTSVVEEQRNDPTLTALTVRCDVQPGYLRGAAYDTTDGYRWNVSSQRGSTRRERLRTAKTRRPLESKPQGLPLESQENVFGTGNSANMPWMKMEVSNNPQMGQMYFLPLQAAYVQGSADELLVNEHEIVERGLDERKPYTAVVGNRTHSPAPSGAEKNVLLKIPDDLNPVLQRYSDVAFRPEQDVPGKIKAVEDYFRERYRYSLDIWDTPEGVQPLQYFLEAGREAHCEFFASAAALLLRTQGVPTRYVVGYQVKEEYEGTWIVRNAHAHAWAEAYDDAQQRWFIVEATPSVNLPKEVATEKRLANVNNFNGQQDNGNNTNNRIWKWSLVPRSLGAFVRWSAMLALIGVGGALGWSKLRQWQSSSERDPRRELFLAALRRMDRVAKRRQCVRRPNETFHQFSARLAEQRSTDPWPNAAADWYVRYAQALYGQQAAPPEPMN